MTTLIIAIVVLVVLFLILFPQSRVLFKGFGNKFIQDVAGTPEGAEAVYTQAIEKAQDRYKEAKQHLNNVSGKLSRAKKNLEEAKREKKEAESSIENCFIKNRSDDAVLFQSDYEIAIEKIKTYETVINDLSPLKEQAQQVQEALEKELKKLENEKKTIITKMKIHKDSAELYEGLDKLSANSNSDKLLKAVREKAENLEDRSIGAREVHNNKTSTKAANVKKQMGSIESNEFMKQMAEKYKK